MDCTIDELLNYKNQAVVKRFQSEFPHFKDQAEEIFKDLLRFFWASEKHEQIKESSNSLQYDFIFIMDEVMKPIDQMWHVFLLYTKDYMDFCEKYFNQYIHHLPDIVPDLPQNEEAFAENLEKFLHYTYDTLGAEVVERWFDVSMEAQ